MTVTRVTEVGKHSVTVPAHRELRVGTLNAVVNEVQHPPVAPHLDRVFLDFEMRGRADSGLLDRSGAGVEGDRGGSEGVG